jgi:hypothetical protein
VFSVSCRGRKIRGMDSTLASAEAPGHETRG